jgi:hypothetical protein
MMRSALLLTLVVLSPAQPAAAQVFKLAPAVAVEAEDFQVESGWNVVKNGHGNYMVDMIGFNHISGERLLCLDAKDDKGSAFLDVNIPEAGKYRLWVRYEYPAFCETRFRVVIEQNGKAVLDHVMGTKDSPRYGFGDPAPKAQHDPPWGPEGLMDEAVNVPELKAGKARIYLKGVAQPQVPGVAAHRNVDLLYLTRDLDDAWMKHYAKEANLYPILGAFRDSRGPRYEARFTNRGDKPSDFGVNHVYNRIPWAMNEGIVAKAIAAGAASEWVPLRMQDTSHFAMVRFTGAERFQVELRPTGVGVERTLSGDKEVHAYLPPYPGKGDKIVTPEEEIDAVLRQLERAPAPGKKPTKPLCYGGWMPLGQENEYGRKYAQLYAALGFRSLHPANSGPAQLKNLEAVGVPATRSWAVTGYRNPPTRENLARAKADLARAGMTDKLLWYDYGDEIAFSEWMSLLIQDEITRAKDSGQVVTPQQVVGKRWIEWLKANRPDNKPSEYWLEKWGPLNPALLKPDSSAEAARLNPRLYVDSLIFYEESAIRHVAEGAKAVRAALGDDVLCGANYSGHPFYYPPTSMYIKWFRGGAADLGRHSEYFWQVAQAGPMVNGYIAEHFRAGMKDNPRAVLRQYTMPHEPGNTDASFLRSAFTHLAHGATMLDFFGVGMNETFTENHIDHRAVSRYKALRDITHCVGFVEDLLPQARPVQSPVALLVSESTERWDFAGIAQDMAGHAYFGPDFRKTRLHFHLERVGLWTAFTFLGVSPDLIIEEDVTAKGLKGYRLLVLVGDCLPPKLAPIIEEWVNNGGTLLATAGCGRFDEYRKPTDTFQRLFGLTKRITEDKTTFIRPRQELPFLRPLAVMEVVVMRGDSAEVHEMPALATAETIATAEGAIELIPFKEGGTAVVGRLLGKGRIYYVAARPGLAYLWSALQPPAVPDRGPTTHSVPTAFDPGARGLLQVFLRVADVEPEISAEPNLIDPRLLKAPAGYVLPIANYNATVGHKVTLSLKIDAAVKKVASAYHGELPAKREKDRLVFTIPALGYGDVLRLTEK